MKNTLIAILVIVILVLGYLFIKEKTKPTDYSNAWPETEPATSGNNNQSQNPAVGDCNTNSIPSIKILSPNGGENYQAGQAITVKWKSCNVTGPISIMLIRHDTSFPYEQQENHTAYSGFNLGGFNNYTGTSDDGSEQVTLPNESESNLLSGKNYFMIVSGQDEPSIGSGFQARDLSDNLFTINNQTQAFSQPKPSDYPSSTPTFSHSASFTTEPIDMYDQKLGADFLAASPNFASYYRIGTVGCGTSCWGFSVVDLRNGKVYSVPQQSGNGYESKVGSKLYAGISTPNFDYPDPQFDAELAAKNREAKVKWYVFNESTKSFTFLDQGYCNLREGQYPSTNTVVECIK